MTIRRVTARDLLPFAIYCRLSRKKPAKRRGRRRADDVTVEQQEQLCRKYAAEEGLPISDDHVYVDNNRSAWKEGGERPGWDLLIASARRGEIQGVIGFKIDRLSRNMRDSEDLIDVTAQHSLTLRGPKSGSIDLATAHGKREFRNATVAGAGESDDTSERTKATLAEYAADGLLLGSGRLFGFEILSEVEDVPDGVTAVIRPVEAEIIRELAQRMLAGETLKDLADDLNTRGVTTVRGGSWRGGNLGRMLGAPRNAGHAMLHGERVGRVRAIGGPILNADTYEAVHAFLMGRRNGPRAKDRWPLSGILLCGSCAKGRTLAGTTSSRPKADGTYSRQYVCALGSGGCGLTVIADPVEKRVEERVLSEFGDADLIAAIGRKARKTGDERAKAYKELDRLDEGLAQLKVNMAKGIGRPKANKRAEDTFMKLIENTEKAIAELGTAAPVAVPQMTVEKWRKALPPRQHAVISQLGLTITVNPPTTGPRNRFNPERVVIEP